ncbi:WGR domain-containing protein [Nitrosomonas aestuarii]|uniref:WGR domain-containing protein n=1 Tax=Nitrosomonas aestuarii TaxID=52441 RepID=UPI000D30117F|nr:WGR domain-containing protein [Nitrosomonas aestuarii]PTN09673.1 WGR domain-containing protein [Nitrosomonas aestuarii]
MNILLRTDFKTNARGYTLLIARDLFGELSVVRCWYGLHNNRGGHKQQPCHDWHEALKAYQRITARRLRRGYQEISPVEAENAA